jgi:uracil-DNA glycosylase
MQSSNDNFQEVEPVTQEWSFERIATERRPLGWEKVFEECSGTFRHMDKILSNKPLYPLRKHMFRALEIVRPEDVKVILLGQDPYPSSLPSGKPKAQGLSFSINYFDRDIPSSLQNIYKELGRSFPDHVANHGSLIGWAKQGVLLINSALTFCPDDNKPHTELWKHFIVTVLQEVCNKSPGCVAVLLGSHAQNYAKYMKNNIKILQTSHPSGRSCHMGFLGSNIFKNCNDELVALGLSPVDWNVY